MKIFKTLFGDFFTAFFTLFWMSFSLGQLQRFQLSNNLALYLHDVLITVFVIGFLWQQKKNILKLKSVLKNNKLEFSFLIWIFLGMIIGFIESRVGLKSFLYLFRLIDYGIFVFALTKVKIKYSPYLGFIFAGSLISIWGLWQYFVIPDVRFLNIFGWDNHYYRLISTLFDPAFTGMILVITLGLWQRLIKKQKIVVITMQIILTIAIAATFSRASYLALGILFFTQWLSTKEKKKWIVLSFIFISTIFLLPKPGGEGVNLARTSTIDARRENAQENLVNLEGSEWIWGRGLFNGDSDKESYTNNHAQLPDNILIMIINSTGIFGLIYSLKIGFKWLNIFWKKDSLWTSLLIGVLIHSMFNNTLLQPFVFLQLWGSKKD